MQFPQSSNTSNSHKMACSHHFISFSVFGVSISINCLFVRAQTQFILLTLTSYDVGVKRYFDPSDTELLRALHSRNSKNIRNPLIFLQKMASYSCFWRVPSSKILLQASLHRIYDLLTLVSSYLIVKVQSKNWIILEITENNENNENHEACNRLQK